MDTRKHWVIMSSVRLANQLVAYRPVVINGHAKGTSPQMSDRFLASKTKRPALQRISSVVDSAGLL